MLSSHRLTCCLWSGWRLRFTLHCSIKAARNTCEYDSAPETSALLQSDRREMEFQMQPDNTVSVFMSTLHGGKGICECSWFSNFFHIFYGEFCCTYAWKAWIEGKTLSATILIIVTDDGSKHYNLLRVLLSPADFFRPLSTGCHSILEWIIKFYWPHIKHVWVWVTSYDWVVEPIWFKLQPEILTRRKTKGQGFSLLEWPTQNNIFEKVIELFKVFSKSIYLCLLNVFLVSVL